MRRPDHFGLLAPLYDRFFSPPQGDHLAELLELPSGGQLLDVGGGTGRVAQGLIDSVGGLTVADASRKMLMMANQKPGLQAVESLAEKLPFASGSMARVICVDAYHHLADQQRSLKELLRVLAPGGLLIIEEPDIEHFAVKLVALGERLLLMRSHFVRSGQLAGELAAIGAHVEVVKDQYTYWVVAKKL